MTEEPYKFETKDTYKKIWPLLALLAAIPGLIWLICLIGIHFGIKGNYLHFSFAIFVTIFYSIIFMILWFQTGNISYEITAGKLLKKRGNRVLCSINTSDIKGISGKEPVRLKIAGQNDFIFWGIGIKSSREQLLVTLRTLGIPEIKKENIKISQVIIISAALILVSYYFGSLMFWIMGLYFYFKIDKVGIDWPMLLHIIPALLLLFASGITIWLASKNRRGAGFLLIFTILFSFACFLFETRNHYYQNNSDRYYYFTWWWYKGNHEHNKRTDYSTIHYKYGFIDKSGEIVIEPQFDTAEEFSEGMALVGFRIQEEELQHDFNETQRPQRINDFFSIMKGDSYKYGYIDKTGKLVIEPKYDGASKFSDGMARIYIEKKYGYINKNGDMVISPKYDYRAEEFSEGMAVVADNKEYFFIDKSGREAFSKRFSRAYKFSEGLAAVEVDGKYGYVDKTGQMVIDAKFDYAKQFREGMAATGINGKWGYINTAGQIVIKPQYQNASNFKEGLAIVRIEKMFGMDEKSGYIDKNGQFVIEPKFYLARYFNEGIAYVVYSKGWGYRSKYWGEWIDISGNPLQKENYDKARFFSEGLSDIEIDDKYGYINHDGELVIKPQFDTADRFSEGLAKIGVKIEENVKN